MNISRSKKSRSRAGINLPSYYNPELILSFMQPLARLFGFREQLWVMTQ